MSYSPGELVAIPFPYNEFNASSVKRMICGNLCNLRIVSVLSRHFWRGLQADLKLIRVLL